MAKETSKTNTATATTAEDSKVKITEEENGAVQTELYDKLSEEAKAHKEFLYSHRIQRHALRESEKEEPLLVGDPERETYVSN